MNTENKSLAMVRCVHALVWLVSSALYAVEPSDRSSRDQAPMSDGEGPTQSLQIMPMGDSITQGTVPGGYRHPLYNLLTENGFTFEFVGRKTQRGDTCPDPDHWGQGGWQISRTPAVINGRSYVSIQGENRSGLYHEIPDAISATYFSLDSTSTRNIILLQIGINDILHQVVDNAHGSYQNDIGNDGEGEGQEWVAEGCIARLQALLRLIDVTAASRDLRIEVFLGSLCPLTKDWKGDPVSDVLISEVLQLNQFINTLIPGMSFTNISVTVVDLYAATRGNLADGLHPNKEGYAAMARAWYEAVRVSSSPVFTLDAEADD